MASTDILSHTLSSITTIKLDEISSQRSTFEDKKSKLLHAVQAEPDQREKVRILLDGINGLASMGKLKDHPVLSLSNMERFLSQSIHDPSVTTKLQNTWQQKLETELDIHSLKHEYASLYGRLVNEWLAAADGAPVSAGGSNASVESSAFESIGRKEMYEQRAKWEDYVFKPCDVDTGALIQHLEKLFNSSASITDAYKALLGQTKTFEETMAKPIHFDDVTLTWVIEGLLASDLVTDEKRTVLQDFLNNKIVLAEVADVLNMRMSSLDKWKWDEAGTPVEIRRQLNGRYRFYHDEDLLQSILLRYIGVQWSVFFKGALSSFYRHANVWKPSAQPVPSLERKRRQYFLHQPVNNDNTVEGKRASHFEKEILLEQLTATADENRGGYNDDDASCDMEDRGESRRSGQQITQTLLHTLTAEIIMKTRLDQELTVVRTDFAWFGPSLPHSTMFTILEFFGVSLKWLCFFQKVLEAPMKFAQDGAGATVRTRRRGTPISGPLSDMLGETTLFYLDFAFNQETNGARMYRLHDDIWFWGAEETCVEGWKVMTRFAQLTGLEFNTEKTGAVKVARNPRANLTLSPSLPKGDVVWGFLKLDAASGRFLIDQKKVDDHIQELRRQLDACKSVFDWIQCWNTYGARFFTNNFGKPANCYGRAHVQMLLKTFARIQSELFSSTGGSVTSTLKQMLTERFGVENIPEGYLYFPSSMGGLDLKNPFVNLYLIHNATAPNPDASMDTYFAKENASYLDAKAAFENRESLDLPGTHSGEQFMNYAEYNKYREQTSKNLWVAYNNLLVEPENEEVTRTADVMKAMSTADWKKLSPYYRWIVQLYAADMIETFGGLNVVEKGLLPTGMVNMFRQSRFKWQG